MKEMRGWKLWHHCNEANQIESHLNTANIVYYWQKLISIRKYNQSRNEACSSVSVTINGQWLSVYYYLLFNVCGYLKYQSVSI